MTWIFTRPEGLDWLVNVRSTMFEYASKHRPYADMYRAEGLAWVSSGALRSFDGAPEEREIAAMISDFAEWHTEMEG